jgi:hypothetical protein
MNTFEPDNRDDENRDDTVRDEFDLGEPDAVDLRALQGMSHGPSRRSVLLGLGVVGTAVALGITGVTQQSAAAGDLAAAAGPNDDLPGPFRYRGHSVALAGFGDIVMVTIDGHKMVHIMRKERRLHSHLLPFTDYSNARTLINDLIDAEAQNLFVL